MNQPVAPPQSDLEAINSVETLEDCLSEPTEQVVSALSQLDGDILILGAGGKMGPTLAQMARRAFDIVDPSRRVIAVSRFSRPEGRQALEAHGIETVACDLLESDQVERLPSCENVIFMTALKFGSTEREADTWATNTLLPAMLAKRFRDSRQVVFSTGNVYGLTPIARGGSTEADIPSPDGEYAMSCLGRERLVEYFSSRNHTPAVLLRLNYACELRYGVLVDLALKVWRGEPIDLAMSHFNFIWQGDANALALSALELATSPPFILNVSGPEQVSVRAVCETLASRFGKQCHFVGTPASDALLANSTRMRQLLGPVRYRLADVLPAVANWVESGGPSLGKPTHFQSRNGQF